MLSSLFESIDLRNKAKRSVLSGDWLEWTGSELDELVNVSDHGLITTVSDIVRSGREFPDNFWEAIRRSRGSKYPSYWIYSAIFGDSTAQEEGSRKLHLHQSYLDRLTDGDKKTAIKRIEKIARAGWDGRGNDISTETVQQAKDFVIDNKAKKKSEETPSKNLSLKPSMTEHWHRWMPDQVPDIDTAWETLRPLLKTSSKLDIETMLREMEKAGVVVPNKHGSKVFKTDKYLEAMKAKHQKIPSKFVKDNRNTYHDLQMLRQGSANAALISVGLPEKVEKKWKTDHPKLYDFLKQLRKSNHKSVMPGSRPFGWVRIDKLDESDWLIEEVQQDIDGIEDKEVAFKVYSAQSHQQQYDENHKHVVKQQARLVVIEEALRILTEWDKVSKQWLPQWDQWERKNSRSVRPPWAPGYGDNPPGLDEWKDLYKKAVNIAELAHLYSVPKYIFSADLSDVWLDDLKSEIESRKRQVESGTKLRDEAKGNMDSGKPETAEADLWKKDVSAMREVVDQFPRWAMHAVKLAAKEHGVETLWWVTHNQKRVLGGANPPRDSTADKLARKFGFKKVAIEDFEKKASGYDGFFSIASKIKQCAEPNPLDDTNKGPLCDQFLWSCPVNQLFTEATKPLSLGVFE